MMEKGGVGQDPRVLKMHGTTMKVLKFMDEYKDMISGSHGGEYEDGCLLSCSTV
jgi:hypothetical protein